MSDLISENWIKWDLDSRTGAKMSVYFDENLCEGYGFFVLMTEHFYRAKNNKILLTEMQTYARACKCMQNYAKYAESLFSVKLWEKDETHFWQPRVLEEIQERKGKQDAISQARKDAAAKRWAEKIEEKNAPALQVDANACKGMQTAIDKNRGDKKRIESNKKSALSSADFIFPEKLNNQNCKNLIDEFIKHRSEKKAPVTKTQIDKVLKKYSEKPIDFITNLEHSIANGYQGIFPPSNGTQKTGKSVDSRVNVILDSLEKMA